MTLPLRESESIKYAIVMAILLVVLGPIIYSWGVDNTGAVVSRKKSTVVDYSHPPKGSVYINGKAWDCGPNAYVAGLDSDGTPITCAKR